MSSAGEQDRTATRDGIVAAPAHVAIIMDGNGRWAAARGLPRLEGHRRGVEALRRTIRASIELGIRYLTVFSFSSENWKRPREEVSDLMGLLKRFIRNDLANLHANEVRVLVLGSRDRLSDDIAGLLSEAENLTRDNTGLTLVVAFNYGSRQEIVAAAASIAHDVAAGRLAPQDVTETLLSERLGTRDIPDPDLVIRTSGEKRLSNFLLWQAAYAEYVFTPTLWPDFDRSTLEAAIAEYRGRDRRYGGLSSRAGAAS
jgi:undecaprenyl diphosphate synthase